MGCDIHYIVERKLNGEWLGIFGKYPRAGIAGERNYAVFAELAAVRGSTETSKYPQFLPEGISKLALYHVTKDGPDGHSHSWMNVKDFSECYLRAVPEAFKTEYEKSNPWDVVFGKPYFLNYDEDKLEDFRVVFWFDN